MTDPRPTVVPRDLYYHEVDYVRRLEAVANAAREVSKWADGTTIDRLCAAVRALETEL